MSHPVSPTCPAISPSRKGRKTKGSSPRKTGCAVRNGCVLNEIDYRSADSRAIPSTGSGTAQESAPLAQFKLVLDFGHF